MTDQRRSYIDPETREFLLLEWNTETDGWYPAMPTLRGWQCGLTRIYRPYDRPTTLITYPDRKEWPQLTAADTSTGTMVLLERPWIASTFAIDVFREDEIDLADEEEAEAEAETDYEMTVAILSAMPLQTQSQTQIQSQSQSQQPFPKHLVGQILATAEAANQLCAITMEPIRTATAAITSCGHIFQRDAIAHWLSAHTTCPECRQPCRV